MRSSHDEALLALSSDSEEDDPFEKDLLVQRRRKELSLTNVMSPDTVVASKTVGIQGSQVGTVTAVRPSVRTRNSAPVGEPVPFTEKISKKKKFDMDKLMKAFQMGLTREVVYRATDDNRRRGPDVFYYTPQGKQRSSP